ncbi:endospore germination permease [Paenibacillus yanchengensis]|uniref:Endospore germination permease n=1 Tax=Paenibacillus yanchengensis TaxID=2035833 RepID=A0ABW4YQN7_9BACL
MEQRLQISNIQMLALVALSTFGTSSLYAPQILASYADRDSWFVVIIGGMIGVLNALVFFWLFKLHPDKDLISLCTLLFGKWFGRLLALVFIFYFLDITTWSLREFSQFFIITLNPIIPQTWYLIVGAIMAAFAVYHGLETFSRVSVLVLPASIGTFLLIYLLLINQYHPEYLLPVMENGVIQPLRGTMLMISWFGDVMFVSMILKYVKRTKKTVHYLLGAIGITFFILIMGAAVCTMVFGGKATASFIYPNISLIQNLQLFRNIERFDAALVVIWVMSSFIKITVYFWSALQGLKELFNIQRIRLWIIPMSAALIIVSKYKVWGLIELSAIYDKQSWFFVLFQFFIPCVFLLVALVKKKLNNEGGAL